MVGGGALDFLHDGLEGTIAGVFRGEEGATAPQPEVPHVGISLRDGVVPFKRDNTGIARSK